MRRFKCDCGNRLFFGNVFCLACLREVSWCPLCHTLTALESSEQGLRCVRCSSSLWKCANRVNYEVCNRSVLAPVIPSTELLCDCCRYNETIPDLSIKGNLQRWRDMELAKRRLFHGLNSLGLPHSPKSGKDLPGLSFDFKDDEVPSTGFWRSIGKKDRVYTGHYKGKITIHIREADTVIREKLRVDLGEGHRTLIGHFRHEIGHYYWDELVSNDRVVLAKCVELFGDHEQPGYAEALERHYKEGAPPGWQKNFISAYATMHPWEDWAETFAFYLDIVDVMESVHHSDLMAMPIPGNFRSLLDVYARLGVLMNELNRAMGLIDFLPEVIEPGVMNKLEFVHEVVAKAGLASASLGSVA